MAELGPCKKLERALKILFEIYGRKDYWLGFGGLWGLVCNDGVIPDGDLDVCMLFPQDWRRLIARYKAHGFVNSKVILSDVDQSQALYAGFNKQMGRKPDGSPDMLHICVSFWFPHNGVRYFCHDEKFDLKGPGVPKSGYFLKGVPSWAVEDPKAFHMVDWPGLPNGTQVRVPIWPGTILDHCYPLWPFRKQRYVPKHYGDIRQDKSKSYHHGGAISPYRLHLKSLREFANIKGIEKQLAENREEYFTRLKNLRVRG